MNKESLLKLGGALLTYCKKFNIPLEYLFEILEDQKVTPMIRGKAMEYNAYLLLEKILPKTEWGVQKLNLNAQPGLYDEDISVTHRRTGIILKVESKSAVRASINDGRRSRLLNVPHFKVKCHRSRSNIKLAGTTNDRYSVDSFDILITNPENAIFEGNTVGENLEVIYNPEFKELLYKHYRVKNNLDLIESCRNDWRLCKPKDIAEKGFIPRTPYVMLRQDRNWKTAEKLESVLLEVVNEKRKSTRVQPKRRS
jgi:hypothetical protein